MKQFRVVFEYSRGLMTGCGAAFVIAADEAAGRAEVEKQFPDVRVVLFLEEKQDPRAQYERPRLEIVRPECIGCDEPTCAKCVREKADRAAAARAESNAFAERWS